MVTDARHDPTAGRVTESAARAMVPAVTDPASEVIAPPVADPDFEPDILVFACHYCAYAAADLAGVLRLDYPPNVRIIKLPCTGKLEVIHLLRALEAGADGVYAAGCMEGECHYLKGNLWARKRVEHVKRLLAELGMQPERVEMYNMSSAMGARFAEVAREFTERIRALGPNPVKRSGSDPHRVARAALGDAALPERDPPPDAFASSVVKEGHSA